MISKEEFLKEVQEKIFPLIDEQEEKATTKSSENIFIIFLYSGLFLCLAFFVFQVLNNSHDKSLNTLVTSFGIQIFVYSFIGGLLVYFIKLQKNKIKQKNHLGPAVYSILNGKYLTKDEVRGLSFNKLRELHFLPRYAETVFAPQQDCFLLSNGDSHFWVQEYCFYKEHFTHSGHVKHLTYSGFLLRFFLKQNTGVNLMLLHKDSILFQDYLHFFLKTKLAFLNLSKKWQPATTNNKIFDKNYFVFTNSPEKLCLVLTSQITEHFKELENIYQAPVNILFYEGQLILSVNTNKDMFEFYDSGKKLDSYATFYDEISKIYQLIEVLKIQQLKI